MSAITGATPMFARVRLATMPPGMTGEIVDIDGDAIEEIGSADPVGWVLYRVDVRWPDDSVTRFAFEQIDRLEVIDFPDRSSSEAVEQWLATDAGPAQ